LEFVTTYAILGLILYFLYRFAVYSGLVNRKGSAVAPADQTKAGGSFPPGAAPAAAPAPVNARVWPLPGGVAQPLGPRRWTVLDPDTLRSVPARQRVSELLLSLTYAAVSTAIIVGGLSWATTLFADWSQVGQFAGTLLAGSWLVLAQAKLTEGTGMDSASR